MEVIKFLITFLLVMPFAWYFPCIFIYMAFKVFTDEYERMNFFDELKNNTEGALLGIFLGLLVTCLAMYVTYLLIHSYFFL
jgi:hypothetical protein